MASSCLRSLRLRGSHFWCFSGFAGFGLFRFCSHFLNGGFVLIALGFGVLRARSLLRLVVRCLLWTYRVALSTTAGLRSLPFFFYCILCFWSSYSFEVLGGGNEALLTRRTGSAWAAIYFCDGSRSLVAELCFSSLRCLWLQRDASYASYGLLCRLWFDGPGFACNFVASPSVLFLVFVGSHCSFYRVVIGSSLFLHFDQNASDCKRAHVV